MEYVCKGYTNKEIGETIFISENTVKKHIESILWKLQARNRTEAVYDFILRRIAS